jgi:hypothetical protein
MGAALDLDTDVLGDVLTASGRPVVFAEPRLTEVVWDDLVLHLRRTCRYGGAIDVDVLSHLALCVLLARDAGLHAAILGYIAAHDLHEAYIGDVPTPLKELLPGYQILEERWTRHVHRSLGLKYPVEAPIQAVVDHFDRRALVVETVVLQHGAASQLAVKYGAASWREVDAMSRVTQMSRAGRTRLVQDVVWEARFLVHDPHVLPQAAAFLSRIHPTT